MDITSLIVSLVKLRAKEGELEVFVECDHCRRTFDTEDMYVTKGINYPSDEAIAIISTYKDSDELKS